MLGNEAIRQYHAELTEDLHMLNLELQMIYGSCAQVKSLKNLRPEL